MCGVTFEMRAKGRWVQISTTQYVRALLVAYIITTDQTAVPPMLFMYKTLLQIAN